MQSKLIVAAIALAIAQSFAHAGFVVTTSRLAITQGTFAGRDGVTLFIQNTGGNTQDPTFGADLIYYDTTLSSTAANPQFFIRAWDGTIRNTATPSANVRADFGYQGFVPGDATRDGLVNLADVNSIALNFGSSNRTWSSGDFTGDGLVNLADVNQLALNFSSFVSPGSFVRFGANSQVGSFFSLLFNPAENSQTYADGQSVTGFFVQALPLDPNTAGLNDAAATQLAYAVVPTGQPVTFSGNASGHTGPTVPFTITRDATYDAGGGLLAFQAAVPEPTSLGLIALAGMMLHRTRRSAR